MPEIKIGTASYSELIELRKTADSTELSGVAFGSVSAYYIRQGAAAVQITPITALGSATAANASGAAAGGAWWEYDSTNAKGGYRLDLPATAMFLTGAAHVTLFVTVANAFVFVLKYDLVANKASDVVTLVGPAGVGLTSVGLVDGAITAAKFAAGAIDNAAIATDAIGSAELAASAVTKIQTGLSTLDASAVRTAIGMGSPNLDTQLSAIAGFIDTEVGAIKAKTDNLPGDPADASDIAALFATLTLVVNEHGGQLGINQGFRNAVYTSGNLISYDLCTYDTAGHAVTNDGATGIVHKYSYVMTYDGSNNMLTMSGQKIS